MTANTLSASIGATLTERNVARFIAKADDLNGPRVLVIDIETLPCLFYAWGTGKQHLGIDALHTDWSLASIACKWLGIDGMFYADNRFHADPRDDAEQIECLHAILSSADMIIAHNGAKFDLPKIKARMAIRDYAPLPPLKVIDTYQLQAKAFGFTSQKLVYVSGFASDDHKDEHKKFPGRELWTQCLAHNPEAWEEMQHYNCIDVIATEQMYLKLRGWYVNQPNFGPYVGSERSACYEKTLAGG